MLFNCRLEQQYSPVHSGSTVTLHPNSPFLVHSQSQFLKLQSLRPIPATQYLNLHATLDKVQFSPCGRYLLLVMEGSKLKIVEYQADNSKCIGKVEIRNSDPRKLKGVNVLLQVEYSKVKPEQMLRIWCV